MTAPLKPTNVTRAIVITQIGVILWLCYLTFVTPRSVAGDLSAPGGFVDLSASDGNPYISLRDENGIVRISLSTASLTFRGPNGADRISLQVLDDGSASVTLRGAQAADGLTPSVSIGSRVDGDAFVSFASPERGLGHLSADSSSCELMLGNIADGRLIRISGPVGETAGIEILDRGTKIWATPK